MGIISDSPATSAPSQDTIAAKLANPFSTPVRVVARPPDFSGGFTITEFVDGQPVDPKQVLTLNGSNMPMQPFGYGGEQRLVKTYYPGNPEVGVHVMGAKENDWVIHGRFKDRRYKQADLYGVAFKFSLAVEAIRKRGNLCKFGMHGVAGDIFRYGFLEKCDFKMNKQSWIDYEITFLVVSETRPINNYFSAPDKSAPASANQNLINAATAFQAAYTAVPTSMPQSLADKINGLVNTVATNVNLVTNFVSNLITTAQDIEASANRALGLIKNARATISQFQRQIDNVAHTFAGFANGSAVTQALGTFKNIDHINKASASSRDLGTLLAQLQAQFKAIAQTLPKARAKVVDGDTLQMLSVKYYGASEHWDAIYDHNKLTSTILVPGTILEIPNL